jgi:hypothetical protein
VKRLSHMPYQSYRYRRRSLTERLPIKTILLSLVTGVLAAAVFAWLGGAFTFTTGILAIRSQITLDVALGLGTIDAIVIALIVKSDE